MSKVYSFSFYVDELFLPTTKQVEVSEYDVIHCQVPSRATAVKDATFKAKLTKQYYLSITVGYNARSTVYLKDLVNAEKLWAYGDGHGKKWQLFARVDAFPVTLKLDVPGHHDHYRVLIVMTVLEDGTVKLEEDFAAVPEV